jgi:hypothetical protein
MAELALAHPGMPGLLDPAEARSLARAIVRRLAAPFRPIAAGPGGEPKGSGSPRGNSPAAGYLAAALERCADAGAAAESASQAEPWRAAALERERFLLSVFAPESDWSERIETIPVGQPEPAERLLARLREAIPEDIAFAPGAERRVFGARPARFATAADLRLARLLLRPGTLRVSGAAAELAWPLASVDLALRRAGWDQDPGWVPWLGRNLRFAFGADP